MAGAARSGDARGPWLTAVLNAGAAHRFSGRPGRRRGGGTPAGPPRRRGVPASAPPRAGDRGHAARRRAAPVPAGARRSGCSPGTRTWPACSRPASTTCWGRCAGPASSGWPVSRSVTRRRGSLGPAPGRRHRHRPHPALVDDLDDLGPVARSRDPRVLERWLPILTAREPDRRARDFLRAAARLHAAIGQLELAVVAERRAALLTLVDGAQRWPWWASGTTRRCAPSWARPPWASLHPARDWPPVPRLRSRSGVDAPSVVTARADPVEYAVGGLPSAAHSSPG